MGVDTFEYSYREQFGCYFIKFALTEIYMSFTKGEHPYGSPPDSDFLTLESYEIAVHISDYTGTNAFEVTKPKLKKFLLNKYFKENDILEDLTLLWIQMKEQETE